MIFSTIHGKMQMIYNKDQQNQSGTYCRYSGISPEHNKISGIPNKEAVTNAEMDLIEAITNPSTTAPFAPIEYRRLQAIIKLAYIFKKTTYECEDHFSLPSVGNNILDKTTQETPTSFPRVGNYFLKNQHR